MSRPFPSHSTGGGQAAVALRMVLRAPTGPHPVGEPLPIEVELRNISDAAVWVVGVLDGSEAGMRFPHFRTAVLHGGRTVYRPLVEDPLVGPLLRSHFRRLRPGESFDPSAGRDDGYFPLSVFTQFRPVERGPYQYRLTFSSESARPEQWFGRFGQRADEQDLLIDLISRVPRGVLTAMVDVTVS